MAVITQSSFQCKLYHLPCGSWTSQSPVNTSHHLFPLCVCSAAQLNLILCNPMDCILLDSSVHGISQGKNTEVGCHFLLQGIFPTQGLNHVSCLASRFFTTEPLGKPLNSSRTPLCLIPVALSSLYPVYQLLGCIPQAYKARACPASKLKTLESATETSMA